MEIFRYSTIKFIDGFISFSAHHGLHVITINLLDETSSIFCI